MQTQQTTIVPISLGFVNAFLVKGERPVLVDAGIPGSADKILNALKPHGIAGKDLSLILLTHGHYDHYGSALELKQRTGAPVAIHRDDAQWPRTGQNAPVVGTNAAGKVFMVMMSRMNRQPLKPFEPDIILDDERDLSEYGISARAIHTPGHTDGSVSVLLSNGDVIVADLLFGGFIRKNEPSYPMIAVDMQQVKQSVKKVLACSPRTVYVGHGSQFTGQAMREKFAKGIG